MEWSLQGTDTTDVRIVSVYDGDSFSAEIPVCCTRYIFKCRLNGVDTPEIRTRDKVEKEMGYKARDYVRARVDGAEKIRIVCGEFDKYGRLLCNVYIDDQSLSEQLISQRLAREYHGGKKIPFSEW